MSCFLLQIYVTEWHLALGALGASLGHDLSGLSSPLGLGRLLGLLVCLGLLHPLLDLTAPQPNCKTCAAEPGTMNFCPLSNPSTQSPDI